MPTQEYHSGHYELPKDQGASLERNDRDHSETTEKHSETIIEDLLGQRFSCRYFLPEKIPNDEIIKAILNSAKNTPSGSNFQPWRVHVLKGNKKSKISLKVKNAHSNESNQHSAPYDFYPSNENLQNPSYKHILQRRSEFGKQFYGPLGIDRKDLKKRNEITARNWTFFDAPIGLIITTLKIASKGNYLECGMFIMSIIIAARAYGLECCVQEAHATFHEIYLKELKIDETESVVCGIALGFADMNKVKQFAGKQEKMNFKELVSFHKGDDEE